MKWKEAKEILIKNDPDLQKELERFKMKKLMLAIKALILKKLGNILQNDMYCAYHGMELYFVLSDMDNWLREQTKYNPDGLNGKQLEALEEARTMLYVYMEEYGIDFNHVD